MSSLRKLQEKINKLELEKNNDDALNYYFAGEPKPASDGKANSETENRILKLEEQLEKMRQMVNDNEQDYPNNRLDWINSNKRITDLEKDATVYEADQLFTDRTFQDLEHKLRKNDSKPDRIQSEQIEVIIILYFK